MITHRMIERPPYDGSHWEIIDTIWFTIPFVLLFFLGRFGYTYLRQWWGSRFAHRGT